VSRASAQRGSDPAAPATYRGFPFLGGHRRLKVGVTVVAIVVQHEVGPVRRSPGPPATHPVAAAPLRRRLGGPWSHQCRHVRIKTTAVSGGYAAAAVSRPARLHTRRLCQRRRHGVAQVVASGA